MMFDTENEAIPSPTPMKCAMANVPVPSTPEIGPSKVSAVYVTEPAELSIRPGTKKVCPPFARNDASVIEVASSKPGVNARSNCHAYRSTTLLIVMFTFTMLPDVTGALRRLVDTKSARLNGTNRTSDAKDRALSFSFTSHLRPDRK